MKRLRGRRKQPVLKPETDSGRKELLQSQLKNTLDYGWHGSGKREAKEFFESLGPADEVSRISDRITERRSD
jgi:hypothetical protein